MADLPQPPEPEGPPGEAYRRQALEATLAEALRDALLTGRPAPSTAPDARTAPSAAPDGRAASARDKTDPSQAPRPAPPLIGSMRAAGTAATLAGGANGPIGGGLAVSRLVPSANPSRLAGGQIDSGAPSGGGVPSGAVTGAIAGIGPGPVGRLGSEGLEPEDVHAVIEMRRPGKNGPLAPSQAPDREAVSGGPPGGSTAKPATPSQKTHEVAAREESARRSIALSLVAPWSPDCDDILPGLTAKRPPKRSKGATKRAAKRKAQPTSPGKSKKR